MVAYSFNSRFADPIVEGTKGGTIRSTRKWRYGSGRHAEVGGHAFPGEELQLYTGMRTKHCRLIARRACVEVEPITLDFRLDRVMLGNPMRILRGPSLDILARFDGFESWPQMCGFWGDKTEFSGWHVRWLELPAKLKGGEFDLRMGENRRQRSDRVWSSPESA